MSDTTLAPAETEARAVARMTDACRALAEAKTVDDVALVRDRAQAIAHYARQRRLGVEAVNAAAELKLRAERRLGELLAELPKLHGARPADTESPQVTPLADLGVSKMESSRWQWAASVPTEAFERHLAQVREAGQELTSAGVLRLAKQLAQGERAAPEPPALDHPDADRQHDAAPDASEGEAEQEDDASAAAEAPVGPLSEYASDLLRWLAALSPDGTAPPRATAADLAQAHRDFACAAAVVGRWARAASARERGG
jgi:hypothetical protein